MSTTKNWIRKYKLTVGTGQGDVIIEGAADDPSGGLRIRFNVFKKTIESPAGAWFRIYNLSKETSRKIVTKDGSSIGKLVKLEAGYKENCGQIYEGEIKYGITGRESPTDTYVDLYCDQSEAYQNAHVSKTLPAGSTQEDMVKTLLETFEPFSITKGEIHGLSDKKYPKSITMHGMSREYWRDLAKGNESHWWIGDGKVNMKPLQSDQYSGGSVELNENTGLIGMPQETMDGVIVTALINPVYKLDAKLIINEEMINRGPWADLSIEGQFKAAEGYKFIGTADGEYRIELIEWRGDSHAQDWYAIMTCIGTSQPTLHINAESAQTRE